jgi:glutamine synthetase adenylyltransferase
LNKYKIEQFLSIEFVNEPRSQHKNSSNTQYLNKNRSKGQQISHANTKASQKEIQEFMQEYEDHLSSHVGFILEQNIDDYNIEGDFNIQFSIDTNGNIVSIDYAKKSEDELSNVYLMRILKQIQKFKPIPQKYTNDPVSHFQLPINIEQD